VKGKEKEKEKEKPRQQNQKWEGEEVDWEKIVFGEHESDAENVQKLSELFPDFSGSGIYPILSTINHSCVPNCTTTFRSEDGTLAIVLANKDIKAGEELFISYIENEESSKQQREKDLKEYGFICDCLLCQEG